MTTISSNFLLSSTSFFSRRNHSLPKKSRSRGSFAKKYLESFEKGWSYGGKSILLSQQIFNILINTPYAVATTTKEEIRKIIPHLKMFSIINVPLNAKSIPSKIKEIGANLRWKDTAGTLLSSLNFTLIIGDMFDGITTFVNALLQVLMLEKLAWISTIALPIGISLTTMSIMLKVNSIRYLSSFTRKFNHSVIDHIEGYNLSPQKLYSTLKQFLEEHLGSNDLTPEELKHRKETLKRQTSVQIVSELEILKKKLEEHETIKDSDLDDVIERVKNIKELLKQESIMQGGALLTSIISGVALMVFLTSSPIPALPFILLALSFALRIGLQVYRDWKAKQQKKSTPEVFAAHAVS